MRRLQSHPIYYKIRQGAKQLILPFVIFQLIRTILFPMAIDVIILVFLIIVLACLEMDWL